MKSTMNWISQPFSSVQLVYIPKTRYAKNVYKDRNVNARAGVCWHREEFSRGYSFPAADVLCLGDRKPQNSRKLKVTQTCSFSPLRSIPTLHWPFVTRVSLLITKGHWSRCIALLACWALPSLRVVLSNWDKETAFCSYCSPFVLPKGHKGATKLTILLPGNSSASQGIFSQC